MITIVQKEDPVLRGKARDLSPEEIQTPHVQRVIKDMKQAITEQHDAVAIAAPQLGEPLRIFVVCGKVFIKDYPEIDEKKLKKADIPPDLVCINPEIIKISKDKKKMAEGCLSVRWLYGNVRRASKATIKALDENGKEFTRGGSGLLAQIFQHEYDHLEGVLFIDKAEDIEDVPPEKQRHAE